MHVTVHGEETVCTNEHPFYSPVKGWTAAYDLRAGDILVDSNGTYVTVEQVSHELLESPVRVYNFEVDDFHTYFVGSCNLLVHNKCDAMARGRQIHKNWDYGQYGSVVRKEYNITGFGRADAVDEIRRIVYELKPDNPRSIRQGWQQLDRYVQGLQTIKPGTKWTKILITYK